MQLSSLGKTIHLNHTSMNVTVIGNFNVTTANINPVFQSIGWWYDYLSGDSIYVSSTTAPLSLQPGEYHIYTSRRLTMPDLTTPVSELGLTPVSELLPFPNPANESSTLHYSLQRPERVTLELYSPSGQLVKKIEAGLQSAGAQQLVLDLKNEQLPAGVYICKLVAGAQIQFTRLVIP